MATEMTMLRKQALIALDAEEAMKSLTLFTTTNPALFADTVSNFLNRQAAIVDPEPQGNIDLEMIQIRQERAAVTKKRRQNRDIWLANQACVPA